MDIRLLMAITDVLDEGAAAEAITTSRSPKEIRAAVHESMISAALTMNASTGTPNSDLRGIAAEKAIRSTIGGGAKYAGGSGIAGGDKAMSDAAARAQIVTYGIAGAAVIAQILVRYGALVRADRRVQKEVRNRHPGE